MFKIKYSKGFTLIELLAVIIILSVILTLTISVIGNVINDSKEKAYNEQVSRVISNARLWAVQNDNLLPTQTEQVYVLHLSDLIESGIMKNDEIKDPRNNGEMNGCITISYEDPNYEYSFSETCLDDIEYLITYYLDGGSLSGTNPTTYKIDTDTFQLINPTKNDYVFTGWTTEYLSNEKSLAVKVVKGSHGNKTFYATWAKEAYTVDLDNQGATVSGTTQIAAVLNEELPDITIPSKTGYTFMGYYAEPNATGRKFYNSLGKSLIVSDLKAPTTFYAYWAVSTYTFSYQASVQEFPVTETGYYKVELWGAAGGSYETGGGAGAYTTGKMLMTEGETYYIYTGQKGYLTRALTNNDAGFYPGGGATFNGGGAGGAGAYTRYTSPTAGYVYYEYRGGASGGGATDIRLANGSWNDATGLRTRIMVAAGGGGGIAGPGSRGMNSSTGVEYYIPATSCADYTQWPADAGGIISANDLNTHQTAGNAFGLGKTGTTGNGCSNASGTGGGGGGYYGGLTSTVNTTYKIGGSGSSYISGYTGCVALANISSNSPKAGCTTGTTNNDCSVHYSNITFYDGIIKKGYESVPTYDGTSSMRGNASNGYAKITLIGDTR